MEENDKRKILGHQEGRKNVKSTNMSTYNVLYDPEVF